MVLTGFNVLGPFYGSLLLLWAFVLGATWVWLWKKHGFVNSMVVMSAVSSFTGAGWVVGFVVDSGLMAEVLSALFYAFSLWASLALLKKQGGKIVVTSNQAWVGE